MIMPSKISQDWNALRTVYISLLKHFNWSPNPMKCQGFFVLFCFFPVRQREAFGSRACAPPCVTWVECAACISFLPKNNPSQLWEGSRLCTKHCNGNQNIRIDKVICLYMLRDFPSHEVILLNFGIMPFCIIKIFNITYWL